MAIRLIFSILLLSTATAHAQIAGAGGASPEATATAAQHQPAAMKRGSAPSVLKSPAAVRQTDARPAQARPVTPRPASVKGH